MEAIKSRIIEDLVIITPDVFEDYRGQYIETYNTANYREIDCGREMVQDDISISKKNVLRGLHGDNRTWKLVQCVYGEFVLAVVDMNENSKTYLKYETFLLNDRNKKQVYIPRGCVNGHYCLTDICIFSYKQSKYYRGAEEQITVAWNDPRFNINWGIPEGRKPILSRRDYDAEEKLNCGC